jgi:hypothetical protein
MGPNAGHAGQEPIRPYSQNPFYWEYRGKPVLLLGGSKDDNLFQIPDLREHLDELVEAGGNFIRNTMSARKDKGFEVDPFEKLPDGKYDLEKWNEEYWRRFENCLEACEERALIVQIEVWDRFDYSQEHWEASPWRPANNVNYTVEESGLANRYPQPAWRDKQPFFHTIPEWPLYDPKLDLVRTYQERIVDKMLSYSLMHGNVLYCMNNETSTAPQWGLYWMNRIKDRAKEKGADVCVTDMFDDGWKPAASKKLRLALDRPQDYTFIDLSQVNSRTFDEEHWRRLTWALSELEASPRPLNHTKIYSAGETSWGSGTPKDGVERFWRNLIAGSAACRFHRPDAGIGLNDTAKACLAATRKLESVVKFWEVETMQDLLSEREEDEAYIAAQPGERYALFFTDGGSVVLNLAGHAGSYLLKWIDISTGDWGPESVLQGGGPTPLAAPGLGPWAAAITRK